MAFPRQAPHHVFRANAATGKLCTLLHQVEDCALAFTADDGEASQVDPQFASIQIAARVGPCGAKFRDPRSNEGAFDHQSPLRLRIDRRNLEHADR